MPRVIVVSGGGTGIGKAVAGAFAHSGDQVAIIGRRADVLARTADEVKREEPSAPEVATISADLSQPDEVERVRAEIADRYGRVDVLVNNAGGNVTFTSPNGANADRLAGTASTWLRNFQLNVLTAVLLTESLRDLLTNPGRVVMMSSIAAIRGTGSGSYGAAKAALHPYVYDLSATLGPRGVTVNVVAPGYVAETEFFGDKLTPERRKSLIAQTHTQNPGTPKDVASTIHWLASPAAGHVTAQIIQVNGGAERGR